MRTSALAALFVVALAPTLGCSKPEPPQITVKDAKVTDVSLAGITVAVDAEAYNPNAVPLTIQSFSGSAKLDGKYDLGAVTVTTPTSLPAGARTPITVPMAMPWQGVSTMATLAMGSGAIPYTVTGTVKVGGERLAIDLPFQVQGTLTREQIAQSAIRSVPGFVPTVPTSFPQ